MKKKGILILSVFFLIAFLIWCCVRIQEPMQEPLLEETETENEAIVIGFSQLGAESDWRSANTESMLQTFSKENGYTLIVEDAQQKQANQITAIRKFIQQEVDYIVLAPVTETGWETVLAEAKEAGIPVIVVDRMVDVQDQSLFTCWVGSDFNLEGKKATEWLYAYTRANQIAAEDIHIVNIQGTIGASAQIGRSRGLRRAANKYGWDLLAEEQGDFTQTKGYEAMVNLLKQYDNINVVYCENDNEALGAIRALEEAGKEIGPDIADGQVMILSFDGVGEEALGYACEGKIACLVECNPDHGPRVKIIIDSLERGESPQKYTYVQEDIFSSQTDVKSLVIEDQEYEVIRMTEELVAQRQQHLQE